MKQETVVGFEPRNENVVIRLGTKTQYPASSPSSLALNPSVSSPANELVVLGNARRREVCKCSGTLSMRACQDAFFFTVVPQS